MSVCVRVCMYISEYVCMGTYSCVYLMLVRSPCCVWSVCYTGLNLVMRCVEYIIVVCKDDVHGLIARLYMTTCMYKHALLSCTGATIHM